MARIDKRKKKVIEAIAQLNEQEFTTIVFFLMGDVRESADAEKVLKKMKLSFQ